MPTKIWAVGEEVLAADFNDYLQEQVVATFPNAGARDSALPAPLPGMVAYLADVQALQTYTGSAWRTIPAGLASNFAQATANSGSVSATPLILPALSVAGVVSPGGRRWKITAMWGVAQSGAGPSLIRASIREGATQIAGAFHRVENGGFYAISFGAILTPASGAHSYDAFMSTDVGTAAIQASTTQPSYTLVEDLGA